MDATINDRYAKVTAISCLAVLFKSNLPLINAVLLVYQLWARLTGGDATQTGR